MLKEFCCFVGGVSEITMLGLHSLETRSISSGYSMAISVNVHEIIRNSQSEVVCN